MSPVHKKSMRNICIILALAGCLSGHAIEIQKLQISNPIPVSAPILTDTTDVNGKKIEITVNEEENSISVRDYGRGVPFGTRKDGENVLVSMSTLLLK